MHLYKRDTSPLHWLIIKELQVHYSLKNLFGPQVWAFIEQFNSYLLLLESLFYTCTTFIHLYTWKFECSLDKNTFKFEWDLDKITWENLRKSFYVKVSWALGKSAPTL